MADVPDVWLADEPGFASTDAVRAAYVGQLTARVAARESWLPSLRAPAASGRLVSRVPFEYAVLRVVPRVDRGESMNAGVLLYCQARDFLGARVHLDADRLRALDPAADPAAVEHALRTAAGVCDADPTAGPAGEEDPGRAVPLAHRAAQHGGAAGAGAHRSDRRPRGRPGPPAPGAGAAGDLALRPSADRW